MARVLPVGVSGSFLTLFAFRLLAFLALLAELLLATPLVGGRPAALQVERAEELRVIVRGDHAGSVQVRPVGPLPPGRQIGDTAHERKQQDDQEPAEAWQSTYFVVRAVPAVDERVDRHPHREEEDDVSHSPTVGGGRPVVSSVERGGSLTASGGRTRASQYAGTVFSLLKYTVLRLALFIAALWLFWFVTRSALVAVIGAGVVSFLLSYLLLRGPRDELARRVSDQIERRRLKDDAEPDEDMAVEDAVVDAANDDSADPKAKTSGTAE